jgi:hypothetical protein
MQALQSSSQGHSRTGNDTRLRALALLITCLLGLTLVTAAHSTHTHKHVSHGVAVLAVSTVDLPQHAPRPDHHGLAAPPTVTTATVEGSDTSDSSTRVSSYTAQTPQVRGPPAEALA